MSNTLASPVLVCDVEVGHALPAITSRRAGDGRTFAAARVVVRWHGRPLGLVDLALPARGVTADQLAVAIWDKLGDTFVCHAELDGIMVPRHLPAHGLPSARVSRCSWRSQLSSDTWPLATVVITTCGRLPQLMQTLRSAVDQSYPNLEVLVVDNRPTTSGVRGAIEGAFGEGSRVCYVAEPVPGLSRARNAGACQAKGDLVAFTDDDVILDRDWLGSLVAGFSVADRVACVTGLILPGELETDAQVWLEEFGGFSKGFQQRVFDRDEHRLDHPLYPYTVGAFGSGASSAFRRSVLLELGGFDPALGAGTLAMGGEDLDIHTTLVQRGHQLVYEPAALLWHSHPRELGELTQRMGQYGVGLSAMLAKHFFRDAETRRAMLRRLPHGVFEVFSRRSAKNAKKSTSYPRRLTLVERAGIAYGPVAYLRSRATANAPRRKRS